MVKPPRNGRIAGVSLFDLVPATILVTIILIFLSAAVPVSVSLAQTPSSDDDERKNPPIPVGQTNLNLELPSYNSNRDLVNCFHAVETVGVTPKRAHCKLVKVDLYELVKGTNSITTTVTSPEADIYVADRIMRTTNTVRVVREELIATAEKADFNLETKKYMLREKVTILLKHFDIGKAASTTNTNNAPATAPPIPSPSPIPPELDNLLPHDPGTVGQ